MDTKSYAAELRGIVQAAETAKKAGDKHAQLAVLDRIAALEEKDAEVSTKAADRKALRQALDEMGPSGGHVARQQGGSYHGEDLASALLGAGFDRVKQPFAVVDSKVALTEEKTGSVTGDLTDAVQHRFAAAELGLDRRYIFPNVQTAGVAPDETAVATYRQLSRSLASATDMLRAVDATSTKPSTNTVAEPFAADLFQIATISAGTPNVLLANPNFRSWVNTDLVDAYRRAIDAHIVDKIGDADTAMGATGTNGYEDILSASEVVRANGYNPNLVVMSPSDALAIRLLQFEGGDSYVFSQSLPPIVESTAVANSEGFVCDSTAVGTLFLSPFSLAVFEENAGASNSSTVRAESNGVFVVQRPLSVASLDGSS